MHPVHEHVLAFIDDAAADSFDRLALEVFAHQYETVGPYRRFCDGRGKKPSTVTNWWEIPPVPIQAFQQVDLCCGTAQQTFLSSGTSGGAEHRSRHCMPDLRLYRRSAVAGMRRFLFPDLTRMQILSLVRPLVAMPQSSLAQMVEWAIEEFGDAGSACAMTESGPRFDQFVDLLRNSERSGRVCCVMTTTGALIRFFEYARERDISFRLPHGSRLMDTGGDKGAPRTMSRNGIMHAVWKTFAIPGYFCVNEYGMCELSSQFYDNVIAERTAGRFRHRAKAGSEWARSLIVDPVSLSPVPDGETGSLCHFDLANAGTAMAVLSEDIGRAVEGGFELIGRVQGAAERGCSLTLAEWDAASGAA